jgi:hypothetical protein
MKGSEDLGGGAPSPSPVFLISRELKSICHFANFAVMLKAPPNMPSTLFALRLAFARNLFVPVHAALPACVVAWRFPVEY